jgi:hypothetical protein
VNSGGTQGTGPGGIRPPCGTTGPAPAHHDSRQGRRITAAALCVPSTSCGFLRRRSRGHCCVDRRRLTMILKRAVVVLRRPFLTLLAFRGRIGCRAAVQRRFPWNCMVLTSCIGSNHVICSYQERSASEACGVMGVPRSVAIACGCSPEDSNSHGIRSAIDKSISRREGEGNHAETRRLHPD